VDLCDGELFAPKFGLQLAFIGANREALSYTLIEVWRVSPVEVAPHGWGLCRACRQ
jgi:hypothetical protein